MAFHITKGKHFGFSQNDKDEWQLLTLQGKYFGFSQNSNDKVFISHIKLKVGYKFLRIKYLTSSGFWQIKNYKLCLLT